MFRNPAVRYVTFVALGVAVLLLKRHYIGPYEDLFYAYAGNISVSFAVYFMARTPAVERHLGRLLTAVFALAVVELFEATDGFGIMSNVYDTGDFLANAVGVGLAITVDWFADRLIAKRAKQQQGADCGP